MEEGNSNKLVEVSLALNTLLKEYFDQTLLIKDLVNKEDEEGLLYLGKIINQRELIIEKYNRKKEEYNQGVETAGSILDQPFISLDEERRHILQKIKEVDDDNMKKIGSMFSLNKENIKRIENGKRLVNAYQGSHPLTD
jgi:hypothetical protein